MSAQKLHQEGIALFKKGNYETALEKLNQALQAAGDDAHQKGEILNDMGVIHTQLKDFEAAHQTLDKALETFTNLADKKGQAQALGNRAALLQAQGQLDEAVETYKSSATMLEELGENDMAMYVWQAISRLRMKQGQYIAAIGAYEEGVENMPPGSFKQKVLQQILKAPGSLLGGVGQPKNKKDDDQE